MHVIVFAFSAALLRAAVGLGVAILGSILVAHPFGIIQHNAKAFASTPSDLAFVDLVLLEQALGLILLRKVAYSLSLLILSNE